MPETSPYTYRPTASGTFDVYDPVGARVGTGSEAYLKGFPGAVPDPFGQLLQSNQAKKAAGTVASTVGSGTPSYTPYASDSSAVVAGENKTLSDLQAYLGQTPDVKGLIENSTKSINDINTYLSALDKRREEEKARITADYERTKGETEAGQKREYASTNTSLTTRLGGYLGGSASHTGVLNNLAASHRAELAKLDSQRDAAIQAAENAITDKEFAVARMKADEIKNLTGEMYKRQQDFFSNVVKLQSEARQDRESQATLIKDYLDTLAGAAGAETPTYLDPARAKQIDEYYGVPGFTQNYLTAANNTAKAKSDKDRFDAFKSYVELLESIPAGVEVPFGNETVTGIGKTADISTYLVKDSSTGKQYIAAYNKGSGELNLSYTGVVGAKESQNLSTVDKDAILSNTTRLLANQPRNEEGKITASGYMAVRQQLIDGGVEKNYPGAIHYIDSTFLNAEAKDPYGQPLRYFSDYDVAYLQKKLGVGAGFGFLSDEQPAEEGQ